MKVLGLTGGVGMGKSACADLLGLRGIPVVDTDDLARQVVEPGQPALSEIRRLFGGKVIRADGQLDRDALARRVFGDATARRQLEDLLHPRIRELWRAQVDGWRAENRPLAVVVIPLLFETHAEKELDATLCVACSAGTQFQRLAGRGWTQEQIARRVNAQWPVEQKLLLANHVIWSEGSLELHAAQLERILSKFPGAIPGPSGRVS